MQRRAWVLSLVLALGAYSVACHEAPARALTADEVFESEAVIEGLRAPLAKLSKSVMNLSFPDEQSRIVFEASVRVNDLSPRGTPKRRDVPGTAVNQWNWPVSQKYRSASPKELSLWTDFIATVEFFHHFKFYNIKGFFEDDAKSQYRTHSGFKGLAELRSGKLAAVKGKIDIKWKAKARDPETDVSEWLISEMVFEDFALTEADTPLFSDVVDNALDEEDRARLLPSQRDEGIIELILGVGRGELDIEEVIAERREKDEAGTRPRDLNQVAVVDIDRDGFDDFYYTSYDGPAFFFRNRGDGSFEEIADEIGLALDGLHGAFFADLDNDGDADAFVTYLNREEGTHYLRNENGRFLKRNELVDVPLPAWTSPISVADYNNDGLLDVYLGRFLNPISAIGAAEEAARREDLPATHEIPFMEKEEARELLKRMRDPELNPFVYRPGPPNLLLKNLGGGRFTRAPDSESVEIYYPTFSTGWSDFDRDGDMDLYVTNEFGPNQLMMNQGEGRFVDISNDVTGEIGLGMGTAWGDYDNDARPDLYITNMYSKAGLRITAQMQSAATLGKSARGNTLMRNGPDGFTRASGLEPPAALVEAADVAWGGGFAEDLNNDGFLDIYVPAGIATVPTEVSTIGDS